MRRLKALWVTASLSLAAFPLDYSMAADWFSPPSTDLLLPRRDFGVAGSTLAVPPPETLTTKETATTLQNNAAKDYAPYAIMSNNVYGKEQIPLPEGWKLNDSLTGENSMTGFYAQTYERREDGKLKEVVMVFRGTEGIKDVVWGSLLNVQQKDANEYIALVLGNEEYKKSDTVVEFKFAGHSLGGALAQQVSTATRFDAIVFNSSPLEGIGAIKDGNIIRIEEAGEFADAIRSNSPNDIQFNFTPHRSSTREKHSIYSLARGMAGMAGLPTDLVIPTTARLAEYKYHIPLLNYSEPDNLSSTHRPKVIDTTANYVAGTIAYGPLSNLSLLATATGFEARRNAANEITSFDMFGIVRGARNSALAVDTGSNASAGNLNWGRWSGTASTITIVNSGTYPGHNLHYVFGSAPTNIPPSGSVTYHPVGGTNPTSSGGGTNLSAITQGTFNSGTIGVNFATRAVTISNLNFSVSTATFNMNGSSTYNSNALFSGSMTGTCTGAACSGAVTGNHIGTLTGPAAAGIALGYQAHTAGTGMVVGAQGFIKQ